MVGEKFFKDSGSMWAGGPTPFFPTPEAGERVDPSHAMPRDFMLLKTGCVASAELEMSKSALRTVDNNQ
jgi:hypothetical protein